MGDHLEFKGRTAYINTVIRPRSREDPTGVVKYDISFSSIGDLELLLSMRPEETLVWDGEEIKYTDFRSKCLEQVHRIYPSRDGRLFDQVEQADISGALARMASRG